MLINMLRITQIILTIMLCLLTCHVTAQVSNSYAVITIGDSGYTTFSYNESLDFALVTDDSGAPADITAYVIPMIEPKRHVADFMKCGGNDFTDDRTVYYMTGLLIKGEPGTYHVQCIYGDASRFANFLEPVITPMSLPAEADGKTNYILQGDKFVQVPKEGVNIGPNSAYLAVPSSILVNNPIAEFTLEEVFEISDIKGISLSNTYDEWYTLSGIKIPSPSKKGVYIHNNKIIVIR